MNNNLPSNRCIVLDLNGNEISTTYANKALKLVGNKEAEYVCDNPLTIRLLRETKDHDGEVNE